jgi:hypothetical protein
MPESSGFSPIGRELVSPFVSRSEIRTGRTSRNAERKKGIGDAMPAKIRNALSLYRPLGTVLYSSIYRADNQLLVNQHAYGIPAAQAPIFRLNRTDSGDMATPYLDSFERVWTSSALLA